MIRGPRKKSLNKLKNKSSVFFFVPNYINGQLKATESTLVHPMITTSVTQVDSPPLEIIQYFDNHLLLEANSIIGIVIWSRFNGKK